MPVIPTEETLASIARGRGCSSLASHLDRRDSITGVAFPTEYIS
jgi:hypothetical protein